MASLIHLGRLLFHKAKKRDVPLSIENDEEYEVLFHDADTPHATSSVTTDPPQASEVIDLHSRSMVCIKPGAKNTSVNNHYSNQPVIRFQKGRKVFAPPNRSITPTSPLKIRASKLHGQHDVLICHSPDGVLIVVRIPVSGDMPPVALTGWVNKILCSLQHRHWFPTGSPAGSYRGYIIAANKVEAAHATAPAHNNETTYSVFQGTFTSIREMFQTYWKHKGHAHLGGVIQGLRQMEVNLHKELEVEVHRFRRECDLSSESDVPCVKVFARGLTEVKEFM